MRRRSRFEMWYGRDAPPVERRELTAGPLAAQLEAIDLRYVSLGGLEAVRRLFVAIRDASWGTIPPSIVDLQIKGDGDSFRVSFEAFHEAGDLRFRWHGELAGDPDGSLDCSLDGVAESNFEYNRIGFCVLHPREHAGRPYRARTAGGELVGELPVAIGPQRFEDGKLWPLFPSYDRLDIELEDGLTAIFEFEGDLFEMEDQRNWTDASFKTYSTPLELGWPHRARAGQEIRQRVRLTFDGAVPSEPAGQREPARIDLGVPLPDRLPQLGLGAASHGAPLSPREVELLQTLRLDHLRIDLRLGEAGWEHDLARAAQDSRALDVPLELAVILGDEPEGELSALAQQSIPVARFLVFKDGEVATGAQWVSLARTQLEQAFPRAAFAGGTNQWFTEFNRERPDLDGLDAVAYSVTATVHADDDTSVVETPAAQGDTVRSARALAGSLPVLVGPVTIRPRSWPYADLEGYKGLPYQVDPRQCALFGAAWTVSSIKYLATAGAAAVTYFETSGWRGVVETEAGPPDPGFPSAPGEVFPLYHVVADAAERKDGEVIETRSSAPLVVEALALRNGDGLRVLVANLTPSTRSCGIGPLPADRVTVRRLDEASAAEAARRPEQFHSQIDTIDAPGGNITLELNPYAVVRIDA